MKKDIFEYYKQLINRINKIDKYVNGQKYTTNPFLFSCSQTYVWIEDNKN